MEENPQIPKTQEELSQNSITNYTNPETNTEINPKGELDQATNRGNQVSMLGDNVEIYKVGIKDIDTAIFYYFNEVLKPSVVQNGKTINVPIVYGSPERWKSMQADGYYRDKNGKMQAPLIVFRRDSLEKNRNLGNKLDANNPHNFHQQ